MKTVSQIQILNKIISGGNVPDKEGLAPFYIDMGSGVITTHISLDRETRGEYQLCVTVNKDPNFNFRYYSSEINIESGTVDPMRVSFNFSWAEIIYYHPRMRVGNVFGHVCLSVFLSVQAITFEPLDIETYFWYGGTS